MKRLVLILAVLALLSQLAGGASSAEIRAQLPAAAAATVRTVPEPEPAVTYVLNKNTKKFHYPECASADEIKPKNRLDVSWDRDEVIARGYVPCKRCNP